MNQIMSTAWQLDNTWIQVMNSMRNQIQQTVSALYTLLQRLQEVQAQAQATLAAVQAAAAAQAAAAYSGGGEGGSGGSGGGRSDKGGNPSYTPPEKNRYSLQSDPYGVPGNWGV